MVLMKQIARSEERGGASATVLLNHHFPPTTTEVAVGTEAIPPRKRLQVWFIRVCSSILAWTCLVQILALGHLWDRPHVTLGKLSFDLSVRFSAPPPSQPPPPLLVPARIYRSNGYLKVSCNGGLNQMRSAICDMVTVARLLNLTMIVPALDKKSFWADPSEFGDVFNVEHFINSLRGEVRIVKRLPRRLHKEFLNNTLAMAPVSWSNETYYLQQILPLFNKYEVIHFNKTEARLANNGLSMELQKLRCYVNYHALKFTEQIEVLGNKLVHILTERGHFLALHLRYEMDMLSFSGCNHGCSDEEAKELKRMRYAYPWWREKEIISEQRRLQGMCPLTPEETALVLQAMGFERNTQIYIASGEIYGSQRRLKALWAAFPRLVNKEILLSPRELRPFKNHTSQMAALDYIVSISSAIFIPTYDGNMAKVVEGHRRYLGFRKSVILNRKKLVELLDLHSNKTLSWNQFVSSAQSIHAIRTAQQGLRKVVADKPKEEDYFFANPYECLCNASVCQETDGSV